MLGGVLSNPFYKLLPNSSKVLTPNLRDLCGYFPPDVFHLLRPLLGPRLQSISIDTSHSRYEERDFPRRTALHIVLRSVYSACPSLVLLYHLQWHLRRRAWDPHTTLVASHSIQKLHKLRTVAVPAVTKDALAHLGGLSCPTRLEAHLPTSSDLEDIFRSSRNLLLFANLQSVDWVIEVWADVEVFAHLWPHKLTELSFRSKAAADTI